MTEAIFHENKGLKFCCISLRRSRLYRSESINASRYLLQTGVDYYEYELKQWLPLSAENYSRFQQQDGVIAQIQFLEKILTGNILSFAKGMDVRFESEVVVRIKRISDPFLTTYKGVRMTAYDIRFKSNVKLPEYIGLGKGVSLGNGVVYSIE